MLRVSCKNCQKDFYDSTYQKRIFCSRKCQGMNRRGKASPRLGKIHTQETKIKISLSKVGCAPWNKGKEMPQNKGENNANWISDRSLIKHQDERNNPEYKQWRYQVYKRDRHTCRINSQDCKGRVVAHHILGFTAYPELRYIVNNGITLCHAHHPLKRSEEQRLIPFFRSMVEVIGT